MTYRKVALYTRRPIRLSMQVKSYGCHAFVYMTKGDVFRILTAKDYARAAIIFEDGKNIEKLTWWHYEHWDDATEVGDIYFYTDENGILQISDDGCLPHVTDDGILEFDDVILTVNTNGILKVEER